MAEGRTAAAAPRGATGEPANNAQERRERAGQRGRQRPEAPSETERIGRAVAGVGDGYGRENERRRSGRFIGVSPGDSFRPPQDPEHDKPHGQGSRGGLLGRGCGRVEQRDNAPQPPFVPFCIPIHNTALARQADILPAPTASVDDFQQKIAQHTDAIALAVWLRSSDRKVGIHFGRWNGSAHGAPSGRPGLRLNAV